MTERERVLQSAVSMGWLAAAGFILSIAVSQLTLAAVKNDFGEFAHHPGPEDWYPNCVWLSLFLVLAVVTRLIDAAWYRWACAAFFVLIAFGSASHTVAHFTDGDRMAYGLDLVLELAQAASAAGLAVIAACWAWLPRRAR